MSSKANKKFLAKQPFCCLCGGSVEAVNIEHAPPIAFFIDRQLPADDHRVPACKRCNNGSSQHDQVAALVMLIMASAHRHDVPLEYMKKLLKGVKNNAPDAFRIITANIPAKERILFRVNGVLRETSVILVDSAIYRDWLDPWAAKQAYALHYLHTGEIVPPSARIYVKGFSNLDITEGRGLFELVQALPNSGELRQGRKSSGIEFNYKWGVDGENACYALLLQQAGVAVTIVARDAAAAARLNSPSRLFATNAEKGIHRVSEGSAND